MFTHAIPQVIVNNSNCFSDLRLSKQQEHIRETVSTMKFVCVVVVLTGLP